ncbi:sugar isomerase, KpsF/GutQ family protein [Chlamydia ibidis]|uniref:Sugar isomerase, KpsF/GutQ family protein n=2 Tax=Chlamydia ibidis TaxID=1405396 RepID=S7J565_9CHLA|nr:KpsF/GutQ family sugar-phosphate isomerase [Chlamydia ibidis]EPP35353.1 sugar isomerase, KpsF/GutQ family protein [Chlamydia ibidis]EQM63071.1 sugar isomerase, KpsF/GutQ family protein [Chlamydia ibidis 10-1398/6]
MLSPTVMNNICDEILSKQRAILEEFFQNFHTNDTWLLAERILSHSGWLFFSGVGKSGCVARKIVSTLQSFGERVQFLLSGDLLHGDLGVVNSGDIVCLFSKSGETKELLEAVPYLKERNVFLVGITSSAYSSLAVLSDHVIILPDLDELDPYNLVPTTSTICQMLFGDLLSIALLRCREISLETYGKNHPSGQIGLKANKKVKDYMFAREDLPLCSPEDTVDDSLNIFSTYNCGCVCIVNESTELLGIFTDGDLRRSLASLGGDVLKRKLKTVMTSNPKAIDADASVLAALEIMETGSPVTILPVLDCQKRIVGLLHMHTLAKAGLV